MLANEPIHYAEILNGLSEYLKHIDEKNVRIIRAMCKHGLNISRVAKEAGLPLTSVKYRMDKLINNGLIRLAAKINFSRIGVRTVAAMLYKPQIPGDYLLDILANANQYLAYASKCFSNSSSIYTIHRIPFGHEVDFEAYLNELKKLNLIRDYEILWATGSYYFPPGFEWFDFKGKVWVSRWSDWVKEIDKSSAILPKSLNNISNVIFKIDSVDSELLYRLEMNATVNISEVAGQINISPQLARYHYLKHLVETGIVEGFSAVVTPYPLQLLAPAIFFLEFPNNTLMSKFINSLSGKPFAHSVIRVANENKIISQFFINATEIVQFLKTLNSLIDIGVIKDFSYFLLDLSRFYHGTLPYNALKNGVWIYSHSEYVERLRTVSEEVAEKLKTASSFKHY
jgi:DNA-binding Lrp family transcriptional regulator